MHSQTLATHYNFKIQLTEKINDFKARIAFNLTQFWLSKFNLAYFWYKPEGIKTRRKIVV